MTQITDFLSHVDAAGLAGIGLLAIVDWLRRRGPTRACLAAALGLLGVVSVTGQVSLIHRPPGAVAVMNLFCFMASGYALVELRHRLIPLRRHVRPVLLALLITTSVLAIPATLTPVPKAHPAAGTLVIISLLIVEWAGCIAEPAVRFLRASRHLPVVQRKRLRALSAGYLGIAVALVLALGIAVQAAAASSQPNPFVGFGFQVAATVLIPLLYAGFAPPRWLRRAWRDKEADAYKRGNEALISFTADTPELARHAVNWAIRFVGATAGLMVSPDGKVLASHGLNPVEAEELARSARAARSHAQRTRDQRAAIVTVPTAYGEALLVVVAGPFTPFFGSDEVLMLAAYGNALAVAMDRVGLSESLQHQTKRMESLLQAVSELGAGLIITEDGRFHYANEAYLEMTGFAFEELEGRRLVELAPEDERSALAERIDAHEGTLDPARYEGTLIRKDGTPIAIETVVQRLADEGPNRLIGLVHDISARKRAELTLAETARLDPLTGVPNRRAWQEALQKNVEDAEREQRPLCVAILDLDNFKEFNDDWGHQRGDRLLVDVARAWSSALREGDFLSRYGGDEFAVIMPGCTAVQAESVLQRLAGTSPEQASIGIAEWDHTETAEQLVARADAALLRCKRDRRGAIAIADAPHDGDLFTSWSARLEEVLTRRYLTAAYQPIVDLDAAHVIGYEALLRVSGTAPDSSVEELFTTAQRLGYTRALDWVGRRTALECSSTLPDNTLLFVNVSARALLDPVHGSDQMLMLLRWTQRRPEDIVLEISEREIISDLARFCEVLEEYRMHGFRFALDDVGEGHSTLEVLAAANAEFIKVARSLTEAVEKPGPRSAIRAILTFAESSGATVIAEGISDPSIIGKIRELGVRFGQGYELGRPQYFPAASPATALKAG